MSNEIELDFSPKVENHCSNGQCSNCGECCTRVLPLSSKEVAIIHKYIKDNNLKATSHPLAVMSGKVDLTCPFRNHEKAKCNIYSIRPEICRVFQCNQPLEEITRNRDTISYKYRSYDLRKEFYGQKYFMDELS